MLRTKKRSGSRNSSRSAPVSVETVLEEHLSPEIVPKLEPVDHELEMDEDITPILSDGAEDQIENKSALLLGPVVVMEDAHESSVSASDTGQNNGTAADENSEEDENAGTDSNSTRLPFQKLPFADQLPEPEVLAVWSKSRTPEQLACDLMKVLFTVEERLLCNVNGKLGKQQFNVHKVQLIREVLSFFTNLSPAEFEEQWKYCITKIDTANRGLKRNMVIRDGPIYHVEQNLQSFESNQVFNCLTASKKDNPFPPFPCPFCERAYTSWGFRRRHIKAMHTHSQRLSCKWCLVRMETHMDWKKHVSVAHGLSPSDAHNGILILEEANMVLRIPNPQRLDTLVTMIKSSSSGQPGIL
ncbi:hypothetical protein ONE63_010444 [Megalurothrips usitatus]|uniref:C2H2-type domain-containing protein n=1 Tax=Megalurothrips usitatus TaxID=439358 RepID=A0AAV7XH35_9NEOP|nr:hypothetical protein ONE63_010444 [Megalurothrips usitatus]